MEVKLDGRGQRCLPQEGEHERERKEDGGGTERHCGSEESGVGWERKKQRTSGPGEVVWQVSSALGACFVGCLGVRQRFVSGGGRSTGCVGRRCNVHDGEKRSAWIDHETVASVLHTRRGGPKHGPHHGTDWPVHAGKLQTQMSGNRHPKIMLRRPIRIRRNPKQRSLCIGTWKGAWRPVDQSRFQRPLTCFCESTKKEEQAVLIVSSQPLTTQRTHPPPSDLGHLYGLKASTRLPILPTLPPPLTNLAASDYPSRSLLASAIPAPPRSSIHNVRRCFWLEHARVVPA